MPAPRACPPRILRRKTKHICGSTTDEFAKNGKVPNENDAPFGAFPLK